MVNIKSKIIISVVITIIVTMIEYGASAMETQPDNTDFTVESIGTEVLEMCPMDSEKTLPVAARIAKEKNKIGAQIICEDFGVGDENPATASLVNYTEIHISCLPHPNIKQKFLYRIQIIGIWFCKEPENSH